MPATKFDTFDQMTSHSDLYGVYACTNGHQFEHSNLDLFR